ncbi:MAG: Eco57I restriction-modification methylase domain-containing protein [Solirubrobacterales bacterium]
MTLLDDTADLDASLAASIAEAPDDEYGAIFTKDWVVEMILDLVGYSADRDLGSMQAVEPSCGHGSFLIPMIRRLADSCAIHDRDIESLTSAIWAVDLQPGHVQECRVRVASELRNHGVAEAASQTLAESWVMHSDFLLASYEHEQADFVIGNPPYIRLEAVSEGRSAAYRKACSTMGGRSDIYVGFFEAGLRMLSEDGALGFICADRWMRNQYGQRLRALVSENFSVEATVEMHDVDAFDADVSAYPSVVVIRRRPQQTAVVANASRSFDGPASRRLVDWATAPTAEVLDDAAFEVSELGAWFKGTAPWPSGSPSRLALLRDLEQTFPALEDPQTGTRVGIGVATGADSVLIPKEPPAIEEGRLLPLAMAADTASGVMEWSGRHLVNPWADDGSGLVELDDFPKLAAYFEANAESLLRRNVASRRPAQWFRTIDRVDPALTQRPKLLIPDIKDRLHPVLDAGKYYPHHNLYFVESQRWDLEALGGLLLSAIAQMFVECYAVRMRGGFFRFQAQYLRKIRVPEYDHVSTDAMDALAEAFRARDHRAASAIALPLYGLESLPA